MTTPAAPPSTHPRAGEGGQERHIMTSPLARAVSPSDPAHHGAAYYAEGMAIWKAPIQNDRPDGSTTITIGFHACTAMAIVGQQGAESIAAMLCAAEHHEALTAALQGMVALFDETDNLTLTNTRRAALAVARSALTSAGPAARAAGANDGEG